jgi:hypothetical protein
VSASGRQPGVCDSDCKGVDDKHQAVPSRHARTRRSVLVSTQNRTTLA